jgi:hypothetical protein
MFRARLDSIPPSKTRGEVDISRHAEVSRVDNFICRGVVEDGLSVDSSLMGEGAETGDVVVEGNVNFDNLSHEIFNILQLVQLVLAQNILPICDNHACHESTEGRDAVSLTNTQD